ncbi:hypothetical protein EZMO1_1364 [Endozoicomonas montiporae CL-33]|uniref:Uncharacterized protein n=1 Tax=Endozoicomonas montiporae CL-33 TaxID=570277 RepID=A0A142B9X7_9GAMM|nr:hypothetical protein EZMO1_1364 [Endozoicomonas montiporae CL-33]
MESFTPANETFLKRRMNPLSEHTACFSRAADGGVGWRSHELEAFVRLRCYIYALCLWRKLKHR